MPDTALQRFRQFKESFVSTNLPNSVLLDIIESYIQSDGANDAGNIKDDYICNGQLSFSDVT